MRTFSSLKFLLFGVLCDLAASAKKDPSGFYLIGFHFIALGFLGNCLLGLPLSHGHKPTKGLISETGSSSPNLRGLI